ncbi:hypothetical protein Anapl_09385 [Anas platyrhynchos]|uniref:Uncharacterized protein n=1 Tax=Anas platyrhynchos TaxID=8839 RepID=R0M1M4_ANAPL|nr:hypothetical protein Anapl_09385 [Anas platyrhynchos]
MISNKIFQTQTFKHWRLETPYCEELPAERQHCWCRWGGQGTGVRASPAPPGEEEQAATASRAGQTPLSPVPLWLLLGFPPPPQPHAGHPGPSESKSQRKGNGFNFPSMYSVPDSLLSTLDLASETMRTHLLHGLMLTLWRQLPSEGIKRLSSVSDVPLLVLDEGSVPCAKANPALSIKITQIHKTSSKGEENPLMAMLGSPGFPTALFPHLLPSTYMCYAGASQCIVNGCREERMKQEPGSGKHLVNGCREESLEVENISVCCRSPTPTHTLSLSYQIQVTAEPLDFGLSSTNTTALPMAVASTTRTHQHKAYKGITGRAGHMMLVPLAAAHRSAPAEQASEGDTCSINTGESPRKAAPARSPREEDADVLILTGMNVPNFRVWEQMEGILGQFWYSFWVPPYAIASHFLSEIRHPCRLAPVCLSDKCSSKGNRQSKKDCIVKKRGHRAKGLHHPVIMIEGYEDVTQTDDITARNGVKLDQMSHSPKKETKPRGSVLLNTRSTQTGFKSNLRRGATRFHPMACTQQTSSLPDCRRALVLRGKKPQQKQ